MSLTLVCTCRVLDECVAGSPAGSDADVSDMGIVQGHAYGILKVTYFCLFYPVLIAFRSPPL